MRYNKIRKMDISNGQELGCQSLCKAAPLTVRIALIRKPNDFNGGKEFTDEIIDKVLELCGKDYIVGLSILGGEPMHPKNIDGTLKLAKKFKEKYPDKTVWCWTGFLFDRDLKDKEVLNYIDVLVDGRYVDELHDFRLKWCGSSNQRVIDVKNH